MDEPKGLRIAAARARAARGKQALAAAAALAFAAALALTAGGERATASPNVANATAPDTSQQPSFEFGSGSVAPSSGSAQVDSHAS